MLKISLACCRSCYPMSKSGALSHVWIIRPLPTQGALPVKSTPTQYGEEELARVQEGRRLSKLASFHPELQKAGIVLGQAAPTRLPHYIYSVAGATSIQEQAIETSNKANWAAIQIECFKC